MFALCSTVDASRARRDGRHLSPALLLRAMCGSRRLIHPDASRDEIFVKRSVDDMEDVVVKAINKE